MQIAVRKHIPENFIRTISSITSAMIPENYHAVISRIGCNTPAQKICEVIGVCHIYNRYTGNFMHSLIIQQEALCPVRVNKWKLPAFGTACLNDNFDVFRQLQ